MFCPVCTAAWMVGVNLLRKGTHCHWNTNEGIFNPGSPFQGGHTFLEPHQISSCCGAITLFCHKNFFLVFLPCYLGFPFKTTIRSFWFFQGSFDEIFPIYICISLVAQGAFLCAESSFVILSKTNFWFFFFKKSLLRKIKLKSQLTKNVMEGHMLPGKGPLLWSL